MHDRRPSLVLSSLILGTAIVLASTAGAVAGSLITGKQIKDDTVTTKDIKDKTLKAADLAPATVKQLQAAGGAPGAPGARGAQGPQGVPGPSGANGVSGYETVQVPSTNVASGAFATVTASCPSGKQIVGATAYWEASDEAVQIYPGGGNSTTIWVAKDQNPGAGSDHIIFRVVCVTTS